jgi:glycine oxidase
VISGVSSEVVIVGAGVSGLSAAYALLRRGCRVSLVERGTVGRESSWAGGGILFPLLPWHYAPAVNTLVLRALEAYPAWIEGIESRSKISAEYWTCGMTVHTDAPEAALAWCASHDVAAQMIASSGPFARIGLPAVAQARNPRLIRALLEAVLALGARVIEHTTIANLSMRDSGIDLVLANQHRLSADQLVVATGAWACEGLPGVGGHASLRPVRGQMLLFRLPPGTLDTILYRDGLYLIPRRDGHILVGSTLEDAGFDKSTDAGTAQRLHADASTLLPQLAGVQPIRHWAGLRPGSPHNIPVIGPHPDFGKVFLNAGHYRYGLTMAPASAELLADLMTGVAPALDPTPYSWAAAQHRQWHAQ